MILPYGSGDNPHHRHPASVNLTQYVNASGQVLKPGSRVTYTGPAMIPEGPHVIEMIVNYGSWVEARLDLGAYEVDADNLRLTGES